MSEEEMNTKATHAPVNGEAVASDVETSKAMELRKLQQRRQVLKAAALAAPLLITLRAKSAYAGGGSSMHSAGIDYGPGSYINKSEGDIPDPAPVEPPKKKKKKWW